MTMIWVAPLWESAGKSVSILLHRPKKNSYEYRQIRILGLDGSYHETFRHPRRRLRKQGEEATEH